jgi:predicted nuclease of predicted toxin-antitoxin system
MKLLFDQNLSPKLATQLADIFPGTTHVHLIGLDKKPDSPIWDFAHDNGFIIVSKDTDFADYSAAFGFPPHVILIQTGNCASSEIENLLRGNESTIREMVTSELSGLLVLY